MEIFLSHASTDREIVELYYNLLHNGLSIPKEEIFFTAKKSGPSGIKQGTNWSDSIRQAMIKADIVVCFLSQKYLDRKYCEAELYAGWGKKICLPYLIPPISVEQIKPRIEPNGNDNKNPVLDLQFIPMNTKESGWIDDIPDNLNIQLNDSSKRKQWENARDIFYEELKKALQEQSVPANAKTDAKQGQGKESEDKRTNSNIFSNNTPQEFTAGCYETGVVTPTVLTRTPEPTVRISHNTSTNTLQDENLSFDLGNGIKLEMIYVKAGEFMMGSNDCSQATPHKVHLTKDYWIGKFAVTQEQYEFVMKNNLSAYKNSEKNPVENVTWNDAKTFCEKLTKKLFSNLRCGYTFQLPTEAQWEYAARGGEKSQGFKYSGSNDINQVAWYQGNSNATTHPVGRKAPNELGIYDMSGNVSEWCLDFSGNYSIDEVTDPMCTNGTGRVHRGGSFFNSEKLCHIAFRVGRTPSTLHYSIGFRVVLAPKR